MQESNQELHGAQQLRRAQRPAFVERQVVAIFQANAEELAKNVQLVHRPLEIDQLGPPWAILPFDHFFQRIRGASMAASGVEIQQVDLDQLTIPLISNMYICRPFPPWGESTTTLRPSGLNRGVV